MIKCQLCGKLLIPGQGSAFGVPKDEERLRIWREVCKVNFSKCGRLCAEHFSPSDIRIIAKKKQLFPTAVPIMDTVIKNTFKSQKKSFTPLPPKIKAMDIGCETIPPKFVDQGTRTEMLLSGQPEVMDHLVPFKTNAEQETQTGEKKSFTLLPPEIKAMDIGCETIPPKFVDQATRTEMLFSDQPEVFDHLVHSKTNAEQKTQTGSNYLYMRKCQLCGKLIIPGQVSAFRVPSDEERRKKWSEICNVNFTASARICIEHFSPADMVISGRNKYLLPKAVPLMDTVPIPIPITVLDPSIPLTSPPEVEAMDFVNLTFDDETTAPKFVDQETQTDVRVLDKQRVSFNDVRSLETQIKDLKCELAQANEALANVRKIFTEGQVRKLMTSDLIQWQWKDVSEAMYLHSLGPKAYNYLYDKGFPLPHVSTLHRWCRKVKEEEGVADTSINIRKHITDLAEEEINQNNDN